MNIYRVQMNDTDFFTNSSKIVACNISVSKGQVYFKTDKITINYLKQTNIEYQLLDSTYHKIKKNVFINRGIVFGILIFIFLLFMNQYRVSEIQFNEAFIINNDIENQIRKDTKKLLFWDFYNGDLDSLATSLRKKYVNYQWISLDKKGSTIKVVINNYEDYTVDKESLILGDIVAKKAGIIKYYTIYNGGKNVEINKYVKAGDVLISSDLLFNLDLGRQDLTEARGLVLANTYEEIEYFIPKEELVTILTSKSTNYTKISLFDNVFNINKNITYNKSDIYEKTNFNLFNVFKVKKIEEFEKYDIIKTYSKEEAIDLLKSLIEKNFVESQTSDLEKIDKMEVVSLSESKDGYKIKILVKKLESIGVFKELGN